MTACGSKVLKMRALLLLLAFAPLSWATEVPADDYETRLDLLEFNMGRVQENLFGWANGGNLSFRIDVLEPEVSELEDRIDNAEGDVRGNTHSITYVQTDVGTNDANITDLLARVEALEGSENGIVPTHVIDADGVIIATWDNGADHHADIGTMTFLNPGNYPSMVAASYTESPQIGEFTAILGNPEEESATRTCRGTTGQRVNMGDDQTDYIWFFDNDIYDVNGQSKRTSQTMTNLLYRDGSCDVRPRTLTGPNYALRLLGSPDDIPVDFPVPWYWIAETYGSTSVE